MSDIIQHVVFRNQKQGEKIVVSVGFDPMSGEYKTFPGNRNRAIKPQEEKNFLEQIQDSDPDLAQIVIKALDDAKTITYEPRYVKKVKIKSVEI